MSETSDIGDHLKMLARGDFVIIYKALRAVAERRGGDTVSLREVRAEIIRLRKEKDTPKPTVAI